MSNASNWASLTDDALENSPSDPAASAGAGNEGKLTDAVSVVMRQAYLQKRSAQSRQRPTGQPSQAPAECTCIEQIAGPTARADINPFPDIPPPGKEPVMNLSITKLEALPPAVRDEHILTICDRAIGNLNDARDIETVTELRDHAEMFALYSRKIKAALHAQNECQLVVLLAEARIGAELKAAQERGEVARPGGDRMSNARTSDNAPLTLEAIGIPRQRASEMKTLADAGEIAIRVEVDTATKEGRKPSRSNIITDARKRKRVKHTTKSDRLRLEKSKSRARPGGKPADISRPDYHTQFILWVSNGAELIAKLGEPKKFAEAMNALDDTINTAHLAVVAGFLSQLNTEGGAA
jgi:hypothetical protein